MTSVSGDQSPRTDVSSARGTSVSGPTCTGLQAFNSVVGDLRAPSAPRTQSRSALWRRRRPGVRAERVGKEARGAGRRRGAALRPAGWSVRAQRPPRATCPAFFWLFRARAEPKRRGRGCRSRTCGSGASQVSGFRRTSAHGGRLVGTLLARAPVPGARNGRRRRGWTLPSVSNLQTAGPSLPALAAGLGGEEPRLVPGGRRPACAARAAGGRGRNGIPRAEARGSGYPARWPWGGGTY